MGTIKIIGFDEQGQAQRLKIRIARILDYDPVTSTEKENIRETLGVDDSLSGTFTTPLSVTSASDSTFTGGGKVGIGGSPTYELDVQAANARIAASSSAGVVNHLQADNAAAYVGPLSNHALVIKTNNAERLRVDSSGNLGLGLTTPAELLHLNASGGGANNRVLSRSHFGSQYADHALVLGYCTKADTAGNSQMVVTETSGTGATGNPAAIRMKTGAIEFHTANSGTSGAAFDSQRVTIDSSGRLGVNQTAMGSYNSNANNLVVGSGSGNEGMTIAAAGEGGIYFADGTSGNKQYRGYVVYQHTSSQGDLDQLVLGSGGANRWIINSSGDLVSQGGGIDFGSTTSGTGNTVTSGLLDDYEEGDWTPSVSVGSITGTGLTYVGKYTKIGRLVNIYIRVNATAQDINVSSYVGFAGVPFSFSAKASGTVIGEDIDVTAQQGFASLTGTILYFGACGNSSAIGLTATLTGYI